MTRRATRLGFIYPGGGGEHEYYLFADRSRSLAVYLAVSERGLRNGASHGLAALRDTARVSAIAEAARRLAPLSLDAAVWACTSGSFILGRRGAERQIAAIRKAAGAPAGSTSVAFVRALRRVGARRVAVAATYPPAAAQAFAAFLREYGIDVVAMRSLGLRNGFQSSRLSRRAIVDFVRQTDAAGAQAVLVPDTALPTIDVIDELESLLKKPVLTANQVTFWDALRLAGAPWIDAGFGRSLL